MRMKQPELKKGRIEIIPMMDTIFFLLVFFMITWLTMAKINGLGLHLPRRLPAGGKPPVSVMLSVSPSGAYFLDGRPVGSKVWTTALGQRLQAHPNSVVVLNLAASQKAQTLISLMDTVDGVVAASHSQAQVLIATPRVAAGTAEKETAEKENTHAQR